MVFRLANLSLDACEVQDAVGNMEVNSTDFVFKGDYNLMINYFQCGSHPLINTWLVVVFQQQHYKDCCVAISRTDKDNRKTYSPFLSNTSTKSL